MLQHMGLDRVPTPEEALELFMVPPRTPMARLERERAESAERFTVDNRGDRIEGWRWGSAEAPPIFLVHGWGGRGLQLGSFVDPLLARGYQAICWDHPAHGESAGDYCTAIRVAEIIFRIEQVFGAPSGLVCHSFGAIGSTFAMHHGLQVPRAVYLAPGADIPERFLAFGRGVGLDAENLDAYWKLSKERFLPIDLDAVSPYQLAPNLERVRTLIIHDPGDVEVPFSNAERLAAAWPGSVFEVIEGVGHRRIIRDRKIAERAAEFLAG